MTATLVQWQLQWPNDSYNGPMNVANMSYTLLCNVDVIYEYRLQVYRILLFVYFFAAVIGSSFAVSVA